uniref:Poly(A) polymerase n=1 Tax=Amphilophus citrinellus TaxID=61819 RepID=A0A3Q0RCH4_AMPCI
MPNRSQAPTLSVMLPWYGITTPISWDRPQEDHLIQTAKLLDTMKSYSVYESSLQLERAVKRLGLLFRKWLKEISKEMNVSDIMIDKVGGKIFPFGSYHLGVHSKDADINALCVGPGFLERKEVKDIQANEEAYVPVIKLSWEGIEVIWLDNKFKKLSASSVPDDLDLLNDSIVKDMDERCVRSLDGYRVTEEIPRLVPNVYSFKTALRAIRLWAKYELNKQSFELMGFLGGVSWAIMVARICQVYPNAAASTLVIKFFKVFSMWVWPVPIRLKVVENCYYNLPFWNPRVNVSDCYHLMPVISPAYPQQNTSANVSLSTFAIINEEIRRGHAICQEIEQKKANWRKLFEEMDFFDKYQYVLSHVKIQMSVPCQAESTCCHAAQLTSRWPPRRTFCICEACHQPSAPQVQKNIMNRNLS